MYSQIAKGGLHLLVMLVLAIGCSSAEKKTEVEAPKSDPTQARIQELTNTVATLTSHINELEGKLALLNDKLETTRTKMEVQSAIAVQHPSEGVGISVNPPPAQKDPELGFAHDEAIQSYRKAAVFFEAQKYSEAILAFLSFLEKYADHPLAGAAQYYIGEAYFKQKEYKLALQEYNRVLTSYDRSSHVSDALKRIADAEEILNKTHESEKHRQLLSSLFPQSPAAAIKHEEETKPETPQTQEPLAMPPPTAPLADTKQDSKQ